MGAGEALAGGDLRLAVPLLVFQQAVKDLLYGAQGVPDGRDGLILQLQLLPAAGEVAVDGRGGLPELFHEVGPVMDQHRPGPGHPQGKLVQGLQKGGLLLTVPQYPGLVLMEAPVLRQGLGIAGTELADALIQEAAALRSPLPDKIEVLRAEEDALKKARELGAVFQRYAVAPQLPAGAPVKLRFQQKIPVMGGDTSLQKGVIHPEEDQLPVIPCPVTDAGEVSHGLQEVGLPLGVVSADDVDLRMEVRLQVEIVPEEVQGQGVNPHTAARIPARRRRPRPRGGAFFPAGGKARR